MPKTKNEKAKKLDFQSQSKSYDMFGVPAKRADEIVALFKHAMIDHKTWDSLWKATSKNLSGEKEMAYGGYIAGRMYSDHEMMMSPLRGLFGGLGHQH